MPRAKPGQVFTAPLFFLSNLKKKKTYRLKLQMCFPPWAYLQVGLQDRADFKSGWPDCTCRPRSEAREVSLATGSLRRPSPAHRDPYLLPLAQRHPHDPTVYVQESRRGLSPTRAKRFGTLMARSSGRVGPPGLLGTSAKTLTWPIVKYATDICDPPHQHLSSSVETLMRCDETFKPGRGGRAVAMLSRKRLNS
jgi:hypothetical protein